MAAIRAVPIRQHGRVPQPDAADPSMVERAVSVVETDDPDDVATWLAMGERLRKRELPD